MIIADLQNLLASLADHTRLRLLHLLFARQQHAWAVSQIVEVLELPQPTVSRHLKKLLLEGLLDVTRQGRTRLYRLADNQTSVERSLLAALEPFVAQTPHAQQDLRRADELLAAKQLTDVPSHATNWLHDDSESRRVVERQRQLGALFKALARRKRRLLLDGVQRNPGATMADIASLVDVSRQAARKHIGVLEEANLVHVVEDGRHRRLYYNPIPLQMLYEQWTDERTRVIASAMTAVKRRVEEGSEE